MMCHSSSLSSLFSLLLSSVLLLCCCCAFVVCVVACRCCGRGVCVGVCSIHGDVLNVHTEACWDLHTEEAGRGHRQFCLPKMAHVELTRAPEVHQK